MVFDVIRVNPSDVGILKLVDICVENSDPDVLASLTAHAITTGKQHNAALLIVWAHDQETENYFKSTFAIRMPGIYYRYIRFSGSPDARPGGDHYGTVCLPMIYPPQ
jgi:ABC-type tungstate transport system permease subunit